MLNEFQEKMLDELIESSRAKGYVSLKKVAEIADVDSPEFDEIEKALEFENIHIADKTLEEGEDFEAHVDDIEELYHDLEVLFSKADPGCVRGKSCKLVT